MTPAVITLIAEVMLKYGIPAAEHLVAMFKKPTVTEQDWKELFEKSRTNAEKFLERTKDLEPST